MNYKEFRKNAIEAALITRVYARLIDGPISDRLYCESMTAREEQVTCFREMQKADRAAITAEYRRREVGIFAKTTKTPTTLALMAEWECLAERGA